MNRADIEPAIKALDAAVPKDNAHVMCHQYGGGPDESYLVANERGYLRLGIEFLKAAYAPRVPGNTDSVAVDLDYLLMEDSEVRFDWFERRDPHTPPVARSSSWQDIIGIGLGVFLVGVFIIGCGTVGKWAYDLFVAVL